MDSLSSRDYLQMVPKEIHDLLRELYATKTIKDSNTADWIINLWKERWSLEQRLGDMDRTLERFLPPYNPPTNN